MKTAVKYAIGGSFVLALAIGGEALYLHHRNAEDARGPAPKAAYHSDPDDLVFLKHEHPMSFKDARDLKGRTLWVSAGGQMDYYLSNGRTADYAHSQGVLLGAERVLAKDAIEQVAPKTAAFRIPQGDKQVLLVFTRPDSTTPDKLYAVPVGFRQAGDYTFSTDEIFFYDDPHKLYGYWGPEVWKAIDEHRAILGMSERQVQVALGQVSDNHGDTTGDRSVVYDNQGKPKRVTFTGGKATRIEDVPA